MKTCTLCKTLKTLTSFSKAHREKDGLQHRCKMCNSKVASEYRKNNVDKEKIRHAKYHSENRETTNARIKQWTIDNPDKVRVKSRRFYHNNKDSARERMNRFTLKNPDWKNEYTRKWRIANTEHRRQYETEYTKNNPGIINAKQARRRSIKKNAYACWADENKISALYAEARQLTLDTGIVHHVDHIIPLNSKYVCGLHCEDNLQVITASENLVKLNKFSPYSL